MAALSNSFGRGNGVTLEVSGTMFCTFVEALESAPFTVVAAAVLFPPPLLLLQLIIKLVKIRQRRVFNILIDTSFVIVIN